MNLFVFISHKIENLLISLVLKIYNYKIEKKEEKLQELHNEIRYETENYRILLYSARSWANKYNNSKGFNTYKKHKEDYLNK